MQEKLEEKPPRQRILETAHRLFYNKGIRASGIDLIIKEAKVTKVTFYRNFESKNKLILEYLKYRHELWISWFKNSMEQNGATKKPKEAIIISLKQWFAKEDFRGCAFINSVVEYDNELEEIREITANHKKDMANIIAQHIKNIDETKLLAICIAIDGAIIHAQMGQAIDNILKSLAILLNEIF